MPKSRRSKSELRQNLNWHQLGYQTKIGAWNPNKGKPDALYAPAHPVGHIVEFAIQTAVQNLDVYNVEASGTSENQTSPDFGASLNFDNIINR